MEYSITLPVTETQANELNIGDDIALYGEDGMLYGTLKLEENIRMMKKLKMSTVRLKKPIQVSKSI